MKKFFKSYMAATLSVVAAIAIMVLWHFGVIDVGSLLAIPFIGMAQQSFQQQWQVNPTLTAPLQMHRQQNFIGGKVLVEAPADSMWIRVPSWAKDNVIIVQGKRGIGGPTNVIRPQKNGFSDVILEEYDAAYPLDWTLAQNKTFNMQMYATLVAGDICALWQEKEIADLVTTAANYASGHSNSSLSVKWDQVTDVTLESGGVNSIGVLITDAANTIKSKHGVLPNACAMGFNVWQKALGKNPELLAIVKGVVARRPVYDDLKMLFPFLTTINIGVASYFVQSDVDSDGLPVGTFVDLWGDDFLLYYDPALETTDLQANMLAPHFGNTFVMNGFPAADNYTTEGGKVMNFRATKVMKPAILSNDLGYLFKGVLS
ncbi:MAG: hypothetical protein KDC45_16030 [Bacteroidetes bacterium]|nr:hypothetical protein [Bacteroidota bacterium]